ncbi:serine--tRNA ligase [Candidatus Peregrinibacteria bacterium]|nr:MAG: serine--tRNA ligase [Candidatus Peregrinibacteria bacterium]
MIDLKHLREQRALYEKGFAKKRVTVDIDAVLQLDDERRALITLVEEKRAEKNAVSKRIPTLKDAERDVKIAEMKRLGDELAQIETQMNQKMEALNALMLTLPNPAHESVPDGKDDSENKPIRTVGEKPVFDFEPLDHIELGQRLDLIDLETGAKTSGARFYYLKNEAVLLEFALIQWLFQKFVAKGFTPVTVPMLVKEEMMYATGFFPADKNEIYRVNPDEDDLYLVGTSEVALSGLHMFSPLDAAALPKRYIGFSSCFRREAGSYGKDTKGILRVHQFDKMEMFSFCHPEMSWQEHDFLLSIEEEILSDLKLPYQVVNICGGDLGAPAAKKYDCEVWIPTQQKIP